MGFIVEEKSATSGHVEGRITTPLETIVINGVHGYAFGHNDYLI